MSRLAKHLRPFLIGLSLVLTALFLVGSRPFLHRVSASLQHIPPRWWLAILAAIAVQLIGHWLRMLRTKTVIDQVRKGKNSEQFGALAVGYLFNTLLPLRLGELLRAGIIATRLRMSFLYTLSVIILERSIDLLLVGCAVIIMSLFFSGHASTVLLVAATGATILAAAIILVIALLVRENRVVLSLLWHLTGWLNVELCNNLRFKLWSLIFGLQQFMRRKQAVKQYVWLTLASWVCYITSMLILVHAILGAITLQQSAVVTASPYIAVTAPSSPAYISSYDHVINPVISHGVHATSTSYVDLSWLVLTAPMFVLGFAALFWLKFTPKRRSKPVGVDCFVNKLLRTDDLSQEFPTFLSTYFLGHSLTRILHKLELSGQISLVKFFKGGSNAITVLVLCKEKLFVKKVIPLEYEHRLKAQHDWLKAHQGMKYNVKLLGQQRSDDYYAIDLAYDSANVPFFEYAHCHSLAQSKEVISKVWAALFDHLHARAGEAKYYPKQRKEYIDKHIFGCLEKAMADDDIRQVVEFKTVTINGKKYDNLYQIMAKIKSHPQAWRDIATYQSSGVVHGDPSIDNILVSSKTDRPLIIDPAPDGNIMNGPVFDMGKMMQSFYCGYEFTFRDEEPVRLGEKGGINYRDQRSERYTQLCRFVQRELAPKYLSESECRALIFHAAALHIRRLKHQITYCPGTALKFYAIGVKTLNEFLAQYK